MKENIINTHLSPIVVSGFGRSGTTWLSDILSKSLGGLMLFEPFHPLIYKDASDTCYALEIKSIEIQEHLRICFETKPKNRWLLRNHLSEPLENVSSSYLEYLWDNCSVIGFKSIRINHSFSRIVKLINGKSILIVRHPFSVMTSINKRLNFWDEFSWTWHKHHFFERTLHKDCFSDNILSRLLDIKDSIIHKNEFILLMWAISFILSIRESQKCKGLIISYEHLYMDPFNKTKEIMQFLDLDINTFHPSYFFTPSMTTLKTIHERVPDSSLSQFQLDQLFWEKELPHKEYLLFTAILKKILALDDYSFTLAKEYGYI